MKRPWQFSMRALFCLVAVICATVWFVAVTIGPRRFPYSDDAAGLLFVLVLTVITAATIFAGKQR
jgi:hypothetical protein